jgi:hypothetical protein
MGQQRGFNGKTSKHGEYMVIHDGLLGKHIYKWWVLMGKHGKTLKNHL